MNIVLLKDLSQILSNIQISLFLLKNIKLVKQPTSLWASSPGRSGGGAGKGKRACNCVSWIWISAWKSRWEILIGEDDICNDVITLGACLSMFVYICARFRFPLVGGNLTAQSKGSHRGIGGGIQILQTYMQALLLFPASPPERPGELASKLPTI